MSKFKPPVKLTTQKKIFCDQILSGVHQTDATIAAGFSAKTATNKGSQLMREPAVMEYIEAGEYEALKKAEITAEWILSETRDIAMLAKDEGNYSAALKGVEMLGKNKKMWTDVQEHKFEVQQMGRVMIADPNDIDGEAIELEFNVGQEPNAIEDQSK